MVEAMLTIMADTAAPGGFTKWEKSMRVSFAWTNCTAKSIAKKHSLHITCTRNVGLSLLILRCPSATYIYLIEGKISVEKKYNKKIIDWLTWTDGGQVGKGGEEFELAVEAMQRSTLDPRP
eukprot:2120125-Rhodomonas_salina.2